MTHTTYNHLSSRVARSCVFVLSPHQNACHIPMLSKTNIPGAISIPVPVTGTGVRSPSCHQTCAPPTVNKYHRLRSNKTRYQAAIRHSERLGRMHYLEARFCARHIMVGWALDQRPGSDDWHGAELTSDIVVQINRVM